MEARRPIKEQELFYAKLEGKHCAIDDFYNKENSAFFVATTYGYNRKIQEIFTEGFKNALREISSKNRAI